MRQLTCMVLGVMLALGGAGPALGKASPQGSAGWSHDRGERRHDEHHDGLEDRHDGVHERLEERHDRAHEEGLTRRQHRRLHERLERRHDRTHDRIEDRHDEHHELERDRRYGDYRGVYGRYPRGGYYDDDLRYGGYLRGEGWAYLGWIARDPRLASWVLRNFDYNRSGSLGVREAHEARFAIHRMADRNRDGRLSQRELFYWRSYALGY